MLTFFLQNPKQILSKTQILENVFDLEGDFVDENTIAVNIRRLREKIEDNPAAPVYIKNISCLLYTSFLFLHQRVRRSLLLRYACGQPSAFCFEPVCRTEQSFQHGDYNQCW